ncbi:MAG: hypothetical protein K2P93_05555 [Alphaproteobacteria bacterium]|nr:hypothetical protein [Alphaproteobacteria bacterium]
MRILPFMPSPQGYEPPSVELNQEEGVLDIFHPSPCDLFQESQIIAETLILRCVLSALPIENKKIKIQLISENVALESTELYAENAVTYGYEWDVEKSQCQGIVIEYLGLGKGVFKGEAFVFYGKDLPEGKLVISTPLYLKPFQIETQHHQERSTTLRTGQVLSSPPGKLNTQILRGYGGYYKEGIALSDIQQIYYALTSVQTQTRVRLYSSSTLQDNHTLPPLGGSIFNQDVIFYSPPREEEYLSLPGTIAAGYVQVVVETGWGQIVFRSFQCEPVPGHPNFINLYFKP